ncbi:tripartite tricarboxylate transporter substrate-binding protein [Roseiarcaceae bacterium H3SJ34-1]|uniref:Bug family tripartite tricarboxylate transporter substrate binding protein n=1 Tax=Terripilifer ovatus TaxID=3032367 RepID=UPI003AB986A2|nr:tripartite tricarboxylate transporter substrate-binding protein [Roseiarcaceae bacterium H3SJ34-1]
MERGSAWIIAIAISAFGLCHAARAQHWPQMTITSGSSAGGSYDVSARLIAGYLGKYLPGRPQIIVVNVPGAGGLLALNQLYNIAPRDGSALAVVDGALVFHALFGNPAARFDARKFNWIGSRAKETPVCAVRRDSGILSLDDAYDREVILGGVGGARTENVPRALNQILGTKFKIITGYPGTSELILGIERGEIAGICGWSWTTIKRRLPAWLAEGKLSILVQTGMTKASDLSDVPLALTLVGNDQQRETMRLLFSDTIIATPLLAPPDTPGPIVGSLRAAFDLAMKDPNLLADAERQQLDIDPTSGENLQASVDRMFLASKPTIEAAKSITQR